MESVADFIAPSIRNFHTAPSQGGYAASQLSQPSEAPAFEQAVHQDAYGMQTKSPSSLNPQGKSVLSLGELRQNVKNVQQEVRQKQGVHRWAILSGVLAGGALFGLVAVLALNPITGPVVGGALGLYGVLALGIGLHALAVGIAVGVKVSNNRRIAREMTQQNAVVKDLIAVLKSSKEAKTPARTALRREARGVQKLTAGAFFGERGFWKNVAGLLVTHLFGIVPVVFYEAGKQANESKRPSLKVGDDSPVDLITLESPVQTFV